MLIGAGNTRTPIPEMLIRKDDQRGTWQVDPCEPVRGKPFTNIPDRVMAVPVDDDETARAIRAHEMMHARVSPVDFAAWIDRGVASQTALMVTEEVRVNLLCERAGFDVKRHLVDGSENASGERAAQSGDWAGAVYTTVAYANTGSLNPYITGVRRHNPEWAEALRAIANRVVKEMKKVKGTDLGSTGVYEHHGVSLHPIGFRHTERIAEMVDRLANPPQPEDDNEPQGQEQAENEQEQANDNPARKRRAKKAGPKPPVNPEQVKGINPAGSGAPTIWPDLRVERCPLGRRAPGGLGRKRRAANVGRNPRRVHRMITDPDRRIFDAKTKGNGGVVLIDGSASVNFSEADITKILEAAPGATVAVYSARTYEQDRNLWVLADKGRMVTSLPKRDKANGVDLPALVWAVEQRQHPTAPVLWITDGHVHTPGGGDAKDAVHQCLKVAMNGKVIIRPSIAEAVSTLTDLARGRRVQTWWPAVMQYVYRKANGQPLKTKNVGR